MLFFVFYSFVIRWFYEEIVALMSFYNLICPYFETISFQYFSNHFIEVHFIWYIDKNKKFAQQVFVIFQVYARMTL
jgi:hypothetical protein